MLADNSHLYNLLNTISLSNIIDINSNYIVVYLNSFIIFDMLEDLCTNVYLWLVSGELQGTNFYFDIYLKDSLLNLSFNCLLKDDYIAAINSNRFLYQNSITNNLTYINNISLSLESIAGFIKYTYLLILLGILYIFSSVLSPKANYFYVSLITMLSKIIDLGQQEYGSFEDFQILLVYLFYVFATYIWVISSWYTLGELSNSWIFLGLLVMTFFMINVPGKLIVDMGVCSQMYIRGAANSSNIFVELIYDIIGYILVFTRFILQNIRLGLVFGAYFELFEFIISKSDWNFIVSKFNVSMYLDFSFITHIYTSFTSLFINIVKVIFSYLYYLLHLVIVSFIQIGTYLLISIWLFFFLYTSSNKLSSDNYFKLYR